MKKLLIGLTLACMSGYVFAGTTADSTSDAAAVVIFNSPSDTTSKVEYGGTQTIKNTPSVNGPALTTSNDTCMGSTTGSFNIAGLGVGGGSTWVDQNCKNLKNSRELWNMGMKAASMALMCSDPDNRYALEVTGYVCPPPPDSKKQAKQVSNSEQAAVMLGSR